VNINLCVELDKTPTETYEMLQIISGVESLSRSCVSGRFKLFKDGSGGLQDDQRGGRPSTSRYVDIIANVRDVMIRDRRLTLRMTSDELNISKETIHQLLHEDLWKVRPT
jgi:hypothetical protein